MTINNFFFVESYYDFSKPARYLNTKIICMLSLIDSSL